MTIRGKFSGRENSRAKVLRPQSGCRVGDALKRPGVVRSEVPKLKGSQLMRYLAGSYRGVSCHLDEMDSDCRISNKGATRSDLLFKRIAQTAV